MKFLTIFFLLILNINIIPQGYKLGLKGNYAIIDKDLNYQIGPTILLEYSFKGSPIFINGNLRFYFAESSPKANISANYTLTISSIGVSFNYSNKMGNTLPFLGIGTYYNINNLSIEGNSSTLADGFVHRPGNLYDNFSFEITLGVKIWPNAPNNLSFELTQVLNEPTNQVNYFNGMGVSYLKNEKFNYNCLVLSIGLYFKL